MKNHNYSCKHLVSFVIFVCFVFVSFAPVYARNVYRIKDNRLDEISGIVASKVNKDIYYVHNDSGGKSEVYALNSKSKVVSVIALQGVQNRDWEDIAIGPGPDENSSYIYIGEIGDNRAQYQQIYLYRFKEPILNKSNRKQTALLKITEIDTIRIIYEDGPKDAETLFLDPVSGDAYIVSKRELQVGVYHAKAVLDTREINLATRVLTLDFPLAVGGDITQNRDKIIIKTYEKVFYWPVAADQSIVEALAVEPTELPYTPEPQGEAICWSADGIHYLTISEKHKEKPLFLYKYPLKRK